MPYPIPSKPWSVDFVYLLVALPADRGFVRAAKGAFTELGNSWNWGPEGETADSADAAQRWLQAIDETWRLLEMGWPDSVLASIDDIEALLSQLITKTCCGSGYVYPGLPEDQLPQSSDTNPPTTWGNDTIASPWTWPDYKCEGAHLAVDLAINVLGRLANLPSDPSAIEAAAALGWVFVVLKFFGVASRLIEAITNADWSTSAGFSAAIANVETNRESIACAIFNADGADNAAVAMKTALLAAVQNETFVHTFVAPYLPYEMWMKLVYEGSFETKDGDIKTLEDNITLGSHDCSCVAPTSHITWDFSADLDGWTGNLAHDGADGYPTAGCASHAEVDGASDFSPRSPNFLMAAGTDVTFKWYRKSATSNHYTRPILYRASDDAVLVDTGNHSATSTWQQIVDANAGTYPEQLVYVRMVCSYAVKFDALEMIVT